MANIERIKLALENFLPHYAYVNWDKPTEIDLEILQWSNIEYFVPALDIVNTTVFVENESLKIHLPLVKFWAAKANQKIKFLNHEADVAIILQDLTIDAELGYEAPNFILRSFDIDFGDSYFNHSNRLMKILLNQSLWVM